MNNMIYIAKVTNQGQITIPAPLRKQFFPEGSKVIFEPKLYNNQSEVTLKPATTLEDSIGIATKYGAKIPKKMSVEKAIKQSLKETVSGISKDDQRIINQDQEK